VNLTLKEQLSNLPIPRLTTVLRVNFVLQNDDAPFEAASRLIEEWWNEKAAPYDIIIEPETRELSFSRSGFKIEFARTDQSFALSMEEPDSSVADRSWIVDVALRNDDGHVSFGLRSSFRQPHNIVLPEPRAPRFLRRIVDEIGAVDVLSLKSAAQTIDSDSLPFFLALLESDNRTLPIVAVSEDVATESVFADPIKLARFLAGTAHVFHLDHYASSNLTRSRGKDWSVYQGAIRCYLPQFEPEGDRFKHRLWLPDSIERLDANRRNGFLNAIVSHVFTQITAQFEALPLFTPSVVRRQIEEASRQIASLTSPIVETLTGDSAAPDGKVDIPSLAVTEHAPIVDAAGDAISKLADLQESYQEISKRSERHEEIVLKLENDLEQERAGRAETERILGETKAELDMFTEENQQLERQKAVAFGDISKEESEALRPLWQSLSGLFTSMQTIAIKFRRMEQDSDKIYELEQGIVLANQTILNQKATIDSLNRRSSVLGVEGVPTRNVHREDLLEVIPKLAKKQLSLVAILETLGLIFSDRITVLETAFESAKDSSAFQYGEQAFDLLWRLATSYWEEVQVNGDTEARKLFGTKSYSAKERTILTKGGKERRTFEYQDKRIQMDKHLKIGTADNAADTLRVHFEWLADEKRIVIGHCGQHLDF
jgi:hypothetical protein